MSKTIFTDEQIQQLRANPHVKHVSKLGITYTEEFKEHFMSEQEKGKQTRTIFEECGFDLQVIGINRMKSSGKRWRKAAKRTEGLTDRRKMASGRPRTRELTPDQKIEKLKAENAYLKQMLVFRQELARLERQAKKKPKSSQERNSKSS